MVFNNRRVYELLLLPQAYELCFFPLSDISLEVGGFMSSGSCLYPMLVAHAGGNEEACCQCC